MTDETTAPEAAATELPPELEITFTAPSSGVTRQLWVKMPTPEQLLVWKRTLKQLQEADVSGWNGEQVMRALERTRLIVDSLLVHDVDKDWLDDEMLAGTVGLKDTAGIINGTVDAFADAAEAEKAENGNRADRRAAKKATPAKKATRKKAAPGKAR